MHPTTSTNLDVLVSYSITPMFTSTYNIGQDRLRWLHIFSDNVVCNATRFTQPGSYTTGTDFTAEHLIYNENRIDLDSLDCELVKAGVTTLKTNVAKLKFYNGDFGDKRHFRCRKIRSLCRLSSQVIQQTSRQDAIEKVREIFVNRQIRGASKERMCRKKV
jgi:hypothetical protein